MSWIQERGQICCVVSSSRFSRSSIQKSDFVNDATLFPNGEGMFSQTIDVDKVMLDMLIFGVNLRRKLEENHSVWVEMSCLSDTYLVNNII